jgi:hypothetical protein
MRVEDVKCPVLVNVTNMLVVVVVVVVAVVIVVERRTLELEKRNCLYSSRCEWLHALLCLQYAVQMQQPQTWC